MKKKILFIVGTLDSGGVSKSMISLLNTIDKEAYDVSLLITNPTGLFMELLSHVECVKIIEDAEMSYLFQHFKGIEILLKKGHFLLAIGNLMRMALTKVDRGLAGWLLSRLMPAIQKEFDIIVDYGGQHQLYYMVDKLRGKKKISFFHNDYAQWPYYYRVDRLYYKKVDNVFTISDVCLKSLLDYFPYLEGKARVMENISPCHLIESMADENISDMNFSGKYIFLTLGHICPDKGTDFAIKAMDILKRKGMDFRWYFIGDIRQDSVVFYRNILSEIKKCELEENVCFLGTRINPYPYLKKADLYIHPSRFEGKSIALDEAKILCKPIVVTCFSTVSDQFEDNWNASVCEMDAESLAAAIEDLAINVEKRQKYISNLKKEKRDNSNAINVLYEAINSSL